MNAKETKIKEAYGEYSDIALGLCGENGWIEKSKYYTYFPQDTQVSQYGQFKRPKSLQGIEDNNGWIRIESKEQLLLLDKENEGFNMFFVKDKKGYISIDRLGKVRAGRWFSSYTHYQQIIKPQPPIY